MANYLSFTGVITTINDFWSGYGGKTGCFKLMTVEYQAGNIVNFIVSPTTYFVDHVMVAVGDTVTGFYDGNAPTPLIYPPQLPAIVMAKETVNRFQNVKVDFFNSELVSSDGTLKLNISYLTRIMLENGQRFPANPANRDLIVVYGPTTRSIPAQTTPEQIIVMC